MHVSTTTSMTPAEVDAALLQIGTSAARPVRYAHQRSPRKLFLRGLPVSPPAAAEVSVQPTAQGSDVILRLMWGPLPAPFPRVLAAVALLVAAVLAFSLQSTVVLPVAMATAAVPAAFLLVQQIGERRLQRSIAQALGSPPFAPRPH